MLNGAAAYLVEGLVPVNHGDGHTRQMPRLHRILDEFICIFGKRVVAAAQGLLGVRSGCDGAGARKSADVGEERKSHSVK